MSDYSTEQRISALQRYYGSECVDIRYIPATKDRKDLWMITVAGVCSRGHTLTQVIDRMEDGCIEDATDKINTKIELASGRALELINERYQLEHAPSYDPDEAARVAEEIGEQNAYLELLHRTRARYMECRQ